MSEQRPGLRRALAALGYRNFRLFYGALVVAGVGHQLQATAIIWQVYELTSSPLHLGLTGLARGIPIIALSLMGGIIADRVDRRRFIMATQAIGGLLGVVLAVLTATGWVAVWHLYVVTLLNGALLAVNSPARSAIIPSLVPRPQLLNAMALNSTVYQTSHIIGPALAGVSIALLGLPATYLGNGLAHVVTVSGLALMRLGPVPPRPQQSPLHSLLEGLAFVRRQSIILVLLSMDVALTFFGAYQTLMPIFARSHGLGAEGLGLLLSAPAMGSLLGAAAIMSLGDVRYKGLVVASGILAYCAALVLLAIAPWFPLALLAAAAIGVGDAVQSTTRNAIIQSITTDELRGRVSGFQTMLTVGSPPLGQTQAGAVAALVGAPLALIAGATACAAVVLAVVARRRDLRDPALGGVPTPDYPGQGPAPLPAREGGDEGTVPPPSPPSPRGKGAGGLG